MTIPKSRHYLIEGVDLSGKSTLVRLITEQGNIIETRHSSILPKGENKILSLAKGIQKDGSEWIGHLYAEALKWDVDHYGVPTSPVLQDSTILLRALAFNTAAKYLRVVEKLETLASRHPQFTKAYVLTADIETRRQRLHKRQVTKSRVTANDLKVISDPKFFQRMDDALVDYAKMIFNAEIIDTSEMTPTEVMERVVLL